MAALWRRPCRRQRGEAYEPVIAPEPSDRRFVATEWRDNPYFDYLKQVYLLGSRFVAELVEAAEVDGAASIACASSRAS